MRSNVIRIPLPSEGNERWYPLPPDYEGLTENGRRQARVNACRQWRLHGVRQGMTSEQQREAKRVLGAVYARCLRFFESYYLVPQFDDDGEVVFNPFFYDVLDVLPNPPFHDVLAAAMAANRATAAVAPRGSSKSFLLARHMVLRLLSDPSHSIIYATGSAKLSMKMGNRVKEQLFFNPRIQDDWGPESEFGGKIQPSPGEGSRGAEDFQLRNHSWLMCMSAKSRQRGGRPKQYILDDPEYDPEASTDMSVLREFTNTLVMKIIMPMIMRPGCSVAWIGTYLSRQHMLYKATNTKEIVGADGKPVRVAEDPRYNSWVRINQPVMTEGKDGVMRSCWPHMWPIDAAERTRLKLNPDTQTIPEIKEQIGPAHFNSEYMNAPGSGDDGYFPELTHEKHGFRIRKADEHVVTAPHRSNAVIEWHHEGQIRSQPLRAFLHTAPVFITADTSFTNTKASDRKALAVMLVGPDNTLFVLDLWSDRCDESEVFIPQLFRYADKWKARVLGIEVVKLGMPLYLSVSAAVKTRAKADFGVSHLPTPMQIRPGNTPKEARIAGALNWRLRFGLIKFPLDRGTEAPWRRLFDQIAQWNPEIGQGGGCEHDDELDAVHMHQYIVRGRRSFEGVGEKEQELPALERLRTNNYGKWTRQQLAQMALVQSPMEEVMGYVLEEQSKGQNDERAESETESVA